MYAEYTEPIELDPEIKGVTATLIHDSDCQSPYDTSTLPTVLADKPNLEYAADWLAETAIEEAFDLGFQVEEEPELYYTNPNKFADKLTQEASDHVYDADNNDPLLLAYLSYRDGEEYLAAADGSSNLEDLVLATKTGVADCLGLNVPQEKIEEATEADAAEYQKWCEGDCYGFIIESDSGETLDSCFGYIGTEYVTEEAKSIAKDLAEKQLIKTLAPLGSALAVLA